LLFTTVGRIRCYTLLLSSQSLPYQDQTPSPLVFCVLLSLFSHRHLFKDDFCQLRVGVCSSYSDIGTVDALASFRVLLTISSTTASPTGTTCCTLAPSQQYVDSIRDCLHIGVSQITVSLLSLRAQPYR